MKFEIETKKESIVFVVAITLLGVVIAPWIPGDWSLERKLAAGLLGGLFWGIITMTSRLMGAFEIDE